MTIVNLVLSSPVLAAGLLLLADRVSAADPPAAAIEGLGGVRVVASQMIWDAAPHNAFTDLTRWNGRWYCSFREGEAHSSYDGAARILSSEDGQKWQSVVRFSDEGLDLRDPAELMKLDKVYYGATVPFTHLMRYHADGLKFHNLPTLSPEYPESLTPGETVATTLTVGENVLSGKRAGIVPELTLGLRVNGLHEAQGLNVTLNGHELSNGAWAEGWLAYAPEPQWVREGINDIEIGLRDGGAGEPEIRDLRLHIAYEK